MTLGMQNEAVGCNGDLALKKGFVFIVKKKSSVQIKLFNGL